MSSLVKMMMPWWCVFITMVLVVVQGGGGDNKELITRLRLTEDDSDYMAKKLFLLQRNVVSNGDSGGGEENLNSRELTLKDILSPSLEEKRGQGQGQGEGHFSYRAYPVFKKALSEEKDSSNFGSIISSGWGEPIPTQVKKSAVPSSLPGQFRRGPVAARNLGAKVIEQKKPEDQKKVNSVLPVVEQRLMETLRYAKSQGLKVEDIVNDLNAGASSSVHQKRLKFM